MNITTPTPTSVAVEARGEMTASAAPAADAVDSAAALGLAVQWAQASGAAAAMCAPPR